MHPWTCITHGCSVNIESCSSNILKNTRLPESSRGCSLLVKLWKLHCGSSGRLAWEPLVCGTCTASPSTLEWAERDSQHSSSIHGRSTTPECSPPLALFSRHRIPASTRRFRVFLIIKNMVKWLEIGFRWRSACSLTFASPLIFCNANVWDIVWQQYDVSYFSHFLSYLQHPYRNEWWDLEKMSRFLL